MALIGDDERERAARLLKGHYLGGRLTLEELTERLGIALDAKRDSDVRLALAELPAAWFRSAGASRLGLDGVWQALRRAAFVFAVWALWWVASILLLVGFVATALLHGVTWANVLVFPALWLVCTYGARRAVRGGRRRRR